MGRGCCAPRSCCTPSRKPIKRRRRPPGWRNASARCRLRRIGSPRSRARSSVTCASSSSNGRSRSKKSHAPRPSSRESPPRNNKPPRGCARSRRRAWRRLLASTERLVELSKRGRGGYVQLLLAADDVRAFGRLSRGVAAVAELDRVRLDTHRRTLEAERAALALVDQERAAVEALAERGAPYPLHPGCRGHRPQPADRQPRSTARSGGAVRQRTAGRASCRSNAPSTTADAAAAPIALPIRPFRGDLPWPATGPRRLALWPLHLRPFRHGHRPKRYRGGGRRGHRRPGRARGPRGLCRPVCGIWRAGHRRSRRFGVHACTVTCPRPPCRKGQWSRRGTLVGRVGLAPAGGAALYFEVRIDGRPVDPVQWLHGRSVSD